jgi:hypothetical protein
MYCVLGKGRTLVRLAVLLSAVLSLGSCGGGGGSSGPGPSKVFVADSGNAAIGSVSNPNPAPGTVTVDRIIRGTSSNGIVPLGIVPALFLDAARNQLYVSNETSIFVFNNASTANGPIDYNRRIATVSPLGGGNFNSLQLDSTRDMLYVGDLTTGIRVYHNASISNEIGGPDRSPDRTISSADFGTDFRVRDIAVDPTNDVLYVAVVTNVPALAMRVFVFDAASTLNTSLAPNRTIPIPTSTYGTMGLVVDVSHDRLFVADSSGDVYLIENAHTRTGGPTSPPDRTIILPSTVTRLAVDTVNDRLYAAGGATALYVVPGVSTASGLVAATAVLPSATGNFTAVAVTP